ncbi:MAG: MFS transporter [Halioglobus sp.]
MFRIFVPPQDLSATHKTLLLLLGAAFFIGQYDGTVLSLALPDVQASFNIPEEDLGKVIALARLGAIPAIFLALLSDRIGRRRLLLITLIGLSVATGLTGFTRTAEEFVIVQLFARGFTTAEEILAVIYVLEMLPARQRGWGVGFLAAMGGLGSGLASLLYGFSEHLLGGWRALYVLAALPILYIAWLRRQLPESSMFEQHTEDASPKSVLQPFKEIFHHHRRAMLAIGSIAALFWFQVSSSLNFMSKYLQDIHDYSTQQVSLLFIAAGSVAILGNTLAGRLSDHVGRRPMLAGGLLLNCASFIAFYNSSGFLLPLFWMSALFTFFAIDVIVNAISGELFPTHCRSTASTLRTLFAMFASVAGLAIEGSLFNILGSHATALSFMSLSGLLAIPVVWLMLRETAGSELD